MHNLLPWLIIGLATPLSDGAPRSHKPTLLLVSFDGFRWDYLTKTDTPNFDRIINGGVKAKWTKDEFVSVTFPNHYTIVTGLYPESHGLIANRFYDPVFDEVFEMGNSTTTSDGKFWGGEPLWVTNQLQGGRTGVYFWFGCAAKIKGMHPTIYKQYEDGNSTMKRWKKRTDTVIKWLTDPDIMVDLALLYFQEPDETGHMYGPDSPEVAKMVGQCDNITGYLLDKLEEHNLLGKLNIIITSDHGMASMNHSQYVTLDDHIDENQTEHLLNYVVGTSIWPKNEAVAEELYQNLSRMSDHISVWKKKDIPPDYHYRDNRRVPPILLSSDEGWSININQKRKNKHLGDHGFNNSNMDMHPFFIATGPVFKKGYVSEPFENIHIYELMCHILGLKPAPNNGSLSAVAHLLAAQPSTSDESHYITVILAAVGALIIAICAFAIYSVKDISLKLKRSIPWRDIHQHGQYSELNDEAEPLTLAPL